MITGAERIIYGSFFGYETAGLPRPWTAAEVEEMRGLLPKFIEDRKSEGWKGIILQGVENWTKLGRD